MSIILEQLTKRYENHPVLNHLSLNVATGEFFVLLGAKGSGKTTLLNLIGGVTPVDQGRVLLQERDVTLLPAPERRVGYVFQQATIFEQMSVADNIAFGLGLCKLSSTERQQRLDNLLELVGLTGLESRLPTQIAGGPQRVALALALSKQPDILLIDEPFTGLDAKLRSELQRLLKTVQRTLGITTLLTTQDEVDAFALADRLGVISAGCLVEVDKPQALYQHPKTEFVATALGAANLLVGLATRDSIHIGPYHFPLPDELPAVPLDNARRVQVLFRPEEVVLAPTEQALRCPALGEGEVEQIIFAGSFERLQLRLPRIPGVRQIAPPPAYGGNTLVIEALRTQAQASRLPLRVGQRIWVGIHQLHTLTHPGLRLLLLTDGSPQAQAALAVACEIGRLAQARMTLLGCGLTDETLLRQLQALKEQLGDELAEVKTHATLHPPAEAIVCELEHQTYDLVVLPGLLDNAALAEKILQTGEHHLLLIPGAQPPPARALICVAGGEPGKDDVLFTGRLIRHLEAKATLFSVLPESEDTAESHEWLRRFLQGGVTTLDLLSVPAQAVIRVGMARTEILHELAAGDYGLLALGAPLPDRTGKIGLNGLVSDLLTTVKDRSILIIRSSI
ncbi:MAG: ATP-binding cassette domain-containing protein [Caldilineaceae bacterium]